MGTGRIAQVSLIHVQSGGSTGAPKQLLRPIETWVNSAEAEAQAFGITAQDRFAVLGSERHSLWGYAHFRAELVGARCVGVSSQVLSSLKVETSQQWDAQAPTVLYGVPELVTTFARLLQRQRRAAPSVRLLLLGGGPVSPAFPMKLVASVFPAACLWSFYGTSETSFVGYRRLPVTYEQGHLQEAYQPFPSVQVDIRVEGDSDEVGEIWVKSPMTITPDVWVNTGDLGQWALNGGFRLLGRANRQLVIKGEKHLVEPVEEALMRQFGLERLVLLVDDLGQVCCLMVSSGGEALSLEQVNEAMRSQGPSLPGVRQVIALRAEDWPLTLAGKTDFLALQTWLKNGAA
jgi:long-chain acyl-CoA synthetase